MLGMTFGYKTKKEHESPIKKEKSIYNNDSPG